MNIYLQTLLFVSSVIAGGVLVDLLKRGKNIQLLLSFSGGFLLTIIFTHILPESYEQLESTGFYILIGFFLQLILEYFSKGAEHGHTHVEHQKATRFPLAIFISLSLHALIEALPLNHVIHVGHTHYFNDLYWGVFVHKIPVAVALKTILDASGMSKIRSWVYLGIFALMAPIGLFAGTFLVANFGISLNWMLAVAIGMFFHVATTIIFESSEGHTINFLKLVAILSGFGIGLFIG